MTDSELKGIIGGRKKWGIGLLVGAGISFLIGLIDGYIRPLSCNK